MKSKFLKISVCLLFIVGLITVTACSLLGGDKDKSTSSIGLSGLTAKTDGDPTYDGTAKTVKVFLYDGNNLVTTVDGIKPHPDLVAEYSDNVEPGEHYVRITPKDGSDKFRGVMNVNFSILCIPETTAVDLEDLCEKASSGHYKKVILGADISDTEKNLSVDRVTTLEVNGHILELSFINNRGTVSLSGKSKIVVDYLMNNGEYTAKEKGSEIYTNKDINLGGIASDITVYIRKPIGMSLEKGIYEYTGEEITPEVITDAPDGEYTVEYFDNLNVGTGKVKITASRFSQSVFGETTVLFTIKTVPRIATDDESLAEIMKNANYTDITLNGEFTDITVPEGYTVKTKGVTAQNVKVNGSLTVEAGTELNAVDITVNGYMKVEGNASAVTFVNNGEAVCGGLITVSGSVKNSGLLTNNVTATLDIKGSISVTETGKIVNAGTAFFDGEFKSEGYISNNGTAYLTGTDFRVSNKLENTGHVITDRDVDFVFTNYKGKQFVRRPASSELITLTDTMMRYTGYDVKPLIIFGTDGPTVSDSDYEKTRSYVGSEYNAYETKYPGEVNYKIEFKRTSKSYTGALILNYTIQRGIYEITEKNKTTANPDDAFGNEYYEAVLISCEYETNRDFAVPEYSELRIGESGKLNYKGRLTVSGKVVNDGALALPNDGQIVVNPGGVVINNADLYTNGCSTDVITGEGRIFVRREINNACIKDLPETVEFNSLYGVTPPFSVVIDETVIDSENYSGRYNGYTSLGMASLTVTARPFSPLIYGEAHASYRIVQGEITVTSYSNMMDALKKGSVFHTVRLGANVYKSIGSITYPHPKELITVQNGVTLDCGEYVMNLTVPEGKHGSYTLVNNGTVKMQKYFDYGGHEGSGKFLGYTNNPTDLAKLVHCCQEVHLTGDITENYTPCEIVLTNSAGMNQTKFNAVIVDLEGYTVTTKITVSLDGKYLTIKSNEEKGKGTLKASYWQNSLDVTKILGSCKLYLNNLNIVNHNYANGVGSKIESTNCVFQKK